MSNKKQTAVEWLAEQMMHPNSFNPYIEQAKEMEKEQRIEDMSKMQIISDVDFDGNVTFIFNPEQYYKETYEH